MDYRYLALSDTVAGKPDSSLRSNRGILQDIGMRPHGQVGRLMLFACEHTPVLSSADGSVIIGDLYHRDGRPVASPIDLRGIPTLRARREHILENYWGSYLLIQPSETGGDEVSLMRDPSGGLACAYSLTQGQGFVTSDLAIAWRLGLHSDRIDWEFIEHCLVYPRIKTAQTGLQGIRELLPGCLLAINGQHVSTGMAWSPWAFVGDGVRQSESREAAEAIRRTITAVVRAMAETDRDLLLELSGGLDSSIVGICLAQVQARVACCTAITPLPGADERHYAGLVAERLGVPLLQQLLDFEETDVYFPLPRHSLRPAVWVLGRSVARAMDTAASQEGIRSHFSGSGGDTVFGYLTTAAPAADALRERGLAIGLRTIANLSHLHGCTMSKAVRLTLQKLCRPPKPPYKADSTLLMRKDVPPPLEVHPWFDAPDGALPGDRERIFDLAGNQMFADATIRAEGRHVRMPLLSQPVMEASLRIPSWMWLEGGQNRAIARAAFSGLLPEEILNRRSKGTFMNYTYSAYLKNKEAIRSFLLDGRLQARGLLDAHGIKLFLDTPRPVRDRAFTRIFDLCMIENWIRNHR